VAIEVCRRRDEGVGGEESSAEEGEYDLASKK